MTIIWSNIHNVHIIIQLLSRCPCTFPRSLNKHLHYLLKTYKWHNDLSQEWEIWRMFSIQLYMIKLFYTETRFVTILALHYKWCPQWPTVAHKYTGIHSSTSHCFTSENGNGNGKGKVKLPYSDWSIGLSAFPRPWACRQKYHYCLWRMASATSDLSLPSQPGLVPN